MSRVGRVASFLACWFQLGGLDWACRKKNLRGLDEVVLGNGSEGAMVGRGAVMVLAIDWRVNTTIHVGADVVLGSGGVGQ